MTVLDGATNEPSGVADGEGDSGIESDARVDTVRAAASVDADTGVDEDAAMDADTALETDDSVDADAAPDPDDSLPSSERARIRRRDHDLAAHDRALMNDGSAKWFKQVLDRQARDARAGRGRSTRGRD